MNKILKKENLKTVLVLSVICIIVAALMGAVNMLTAPVIADSEAKIIAESLKDVMPGGDFERVELSELPASPSTVTAVYKDKISGGHVVTLAKQGYASIITITVGIDTDKKITTAIITGEQETHGKSGIDEYVAAFSGKDSSGIYDVETVSGATKTSGYIADAVYDAFVALGYAAAQDAEPEEMPDAETTTTDAEIIAIAKEMMDGDYSKIELPEDLPNTVRAIFKRSGGGYAIHIATRTEWRSLETEGVVTVSDIGTITGVKMLNWIVGYDSTLLDKAPECTDEFINSFIGKNTYSLSRVELITHATNTSNNFTNALESAMAELYPVPVIRIVTVCAVCALIGAFVAYKAVIYVKGRKKNEK